MSFERKQQERDFDNSRPFTVEDEARQLVNDTIAFSDIVKECSEQSLDCESTNLEILWEKIFVEKKDFSSLYNTDHIRLDKLKTQYQDQGFVQIPSVLHQEILKEIYEYMYRHRLEIPEDFDVEKDYSDSLARYAHPLFEALLCDLSSLIGNIVGEDLVPTYSFYRSYRSGARLKMHVDRESCAITCSMKLGVIPLNSEWGVVLEINGEKVEVAPPLGDILLIRGTKVPHGRKMFEGIEQDQVFFHYVPNRPKYQKHFFDGRKPDQIPFTRTTINLDKVN